MDNTIIPRDVLLHLATFLDPFTGDSLRLTCKFLHVILTNTYEKPVLFEIVYDGGTRFYSMVANFSEHGNFVIPSLVYVRELPNETIYEFVWQWNYHACIIIQHTHGKNFAYCIIPRNAHLVLTPDVKFIITLKTMQKILDESKTLIENNTWNFVVKKYKKHNRTPAGLRRLWNI